jgi:TolB-like protein
VLYELTAGKVPFPVFTTAVIFDGILSGTPAPVAKSNPKASPELDRIILKPLEKDRDLRYPTASELRGDSQRLKRDLDSPSRAESARSHLSGSTTSAAAPRTKKTVAVLYFKNLSGAKEDEYFRDGMTEGIITELPKSAAYRFFPVPRCSPSATHRGPRPRSAKSLAPMFVLEGTFWRDAILLRAAMMRPRSWRKRHGNRRQRLQRADSAD